jgi:hypothetical protein
MAWVAAGVKKQLWCWQVTREAFFKNLVSTIYYFLNGSYNVLAANIGQDYTWQNQQGTILYAFGIYNEVPFGVWCAAISCTSSQVENRATAPPDHCCHCSVPDCLSSQETIVGTGPSPVETLSTRGAMIRATGVRRKLPPIF